MPVLKEKLREAETKGTLFEYVENISIYFIGGLRMAAKKKLSAKEATS